MRVAIAKQALGRKPSRLHTPDLLCAASVQLEAPNSNGYESPERQEDENTERDQPEGKAT